MQHTGPKKSNRKRGGRNKGGGNSAVPKPLSDVANITPRSTAKV